MLINHKTEAGALFDEWGFPATLREAVTESERPEDEPVEYPVVRVVSSLSAPQESAEVIEDDRTQDRDGLRGAAGPGASDTRSCPHRRGNAGAIVDLGGRSSLVENHLPSL